MSCAGREEKKGFSCREDRKRVMDFSRRKGRGKIWSRMQNNMQRIIPM